MKKLKPYLLTTAIVLGIFIIVFISKGIYPFGKNSLIWSDMHDQITAFYYHFYDCFKGNDSLLIDFSTSGGINFIGILAYYILSPFSFLVLLVKREEIYLMVSVIIAIKTLFCSLTCLYFIRKYFKKVPYLLSVVLAIVYAFSGYSLMMYIITPWIDAMYLLPLIMIGLKKVLDLEKPTLYIITLALSLILSFYVSIMVIIFVFLISLIYIFVYQDNKELRKKAILSLGISTIISLLLSAFVVVPSYLQISVSSRIGVNAKTLLNSKTGPLSDKLAMFLFGGIMYLGLFLLGRNYKKHKKFLSFYIPVMLIMLIPIMIEPINKIWHFGSYAFFTYRIGFATTFLLIVGACYGYENFEFDTKITTHHQKAKSIITTLLVSVAIIAIMLLNYYDFQTAINKLSISGNHLLILILASTFIISFIGCYILLILNKKMTTFTIVLMSIITFSHIIINTATYMGMDKEQKLLTSEYEELTLIFKDYQEGDYYRVKNEVIDMIMNSGMVMKFHNWDHFTSLTDANNLTSLKKMGYSSMWVKTYSRGGNLFLDSVLANGYLMSDKKIDSEYYQYIKTYKNIYFYKLKKLPSYGYLINNNDTIFNKDNSFQISNSIYQSITGNKDNIFDIYSNFKLNNIEVSKYKDNKYYKILDPEGYNYFETDIDIKNKQTLYLEILRSLDNTTNSKIYEHFNIYINDKLYQQKAMDADNNGVINLGTYNNEKVNIKIELLKSIDLNNITLGVMDNTKYEDFIANQYVETNINYNKNKVTASVESEAEKILYLPIAYSDSYKATNNGKEVEVIKVFDNFIGVKLEKGSNNIELTYMPKGLIPMIIVSAITLVLTIILLSTKLYNKILDCKFLSNIAYYLYLFAYIALILVVYIGGTICFIISYFVTIKI